MITYTYIVKCPQCEDEFFDFFDEAKEFALGCLTKKPIITQTEVNRNDFGECTDHCDLGTVWSWEDMMDATDAEPAVSIFTRDDLECMNHTGRPCYDAEFDALDNSVDFEPGVDEVSAIDDIPDNFRKPIPEGMTIEELVEAMEENEDTVECTKCGGLFEKTSCTHNKEGFGWCCTSCESDDTLVENDHDLGNTYDGGYPEEYDLATLVRDSINHLTNDLGKDPWADDFADDVIRDLENNYISAPEDMIAYNSWCDAVACEVSRQVNNTSELIESSALTDSTAVGKYAKLVFRGSDWTLSELKRSLKQINADIGISQRSINFIVKFDNRCRIMQETDKGYLVNVPCYFRDFQERSKINENPVLVRLWVSKQYCELLENA